MGNIGSGSGSSYPGTLDTQTAVEVDSPAAGKTKARAAVPNDLAACVLAIETELGTNPKGSKADVKTFLQVQHNTDGTHSAITASATITDMNGNVVYGAVTGEASATASAASVSLNLGTLKSGDRIWVSGQADGVNTGNAVSGRGIQIAKSAGTATIVFQNSKTALNNLFPFNNPTTGTEGYNIGGVCQVTGNGTLTLQFTILGTTPNTSITSEIYAYFLKKQ